MNTINLQEALVLTSSDWSHVLDLQQHCSLDKKPIHSYKYLVGPYNRNNCHWLAVIVSMVSKKFYVLDPKGYATKFNEKCFESWKQYYNRRNDVQIEIWDHDISKVCHPTQSPSDNHNCGIFASLFIEKFVKENEIIQFTSTKKDLKNYRLSFAKILEENSLGC